MYTYYKKADKKISLVYSNKKPDISKLEDQFVLIIDNKLNLYSLYLDYEPIEKLESFEMLIFDPKLLNPKFTNDYLKNPDVLAVDLDAYGLFTFLNFGESTSKTKLDLENEGYIKDIISSIREKLLNQREDYWPCQVKTLLNQLLSHITTLNLDKGYENREFDVVEVKKYMDRNYYEPITINLLTKKFFINRDKLQKSFRIQFDTTVIAYLSTVRIEKAKKLLLETKLPISEIIERTGFNSVSNFNEKFKQKVGMSPSRYKKENKIFI